MSLIKKHPSILFSVISLIMTTGSLLYVVGAKGAQLDDHESRISKLEEYDREDRKILYELRNDVKWLVQSMGRKD